MKPGDKVLFVHETGYGFLVKQQDELSWLVEDEHGFERVVEVKELVLEPKDIETKYERTLKDFNPIKDRTPKKKKTVVHRRDVMEVDLHIEELVDDHRGWSNADILTYQLDVFERTLNKAIQIGAQKLIVVHGRGDGVLRYEVRKRLKDYPSFLVHDASFQTFGQGATEVILRK
jgi:dsDNA-specific endonuclease/ATPase MutS2